eukprot:COSAG06_NODE_230_length_19685_cov_14.110844_13_plen_52_part_00
MPRALGSAAGIVTDAPGNFAVAACCASAEFHDRSVTLVKSSVALLVLLRSS